MKIQDPNGTGVTGIGKTPDVTSSGQNSRIKGGRSDRGDQVQLSNLSSALGAHQTNSPERTAHLEQLSASVRAGNYRIDPFALSGSIIQDSLTSSAR